MAHRRGGEWADGDGPRPGDGFAAGQVELVAQQAHWKVISRKGRARWGTGFPGFRVGL